MNREMSDDHVELLMVYYGGVDQFGHEHGPASKEVCEIQIQ